MISLLFLSLSISQSHSSEEIDKAIDLAAKKENIPPEVLKAICTVESKLNPKAFNFNDGGNNSHSFGICQIRMETAKWMGFEGDDKCMRDLRNPNLRTPSECKLFDMNINLTYASKYIRYQLDRYDNNQTYAIAAYNAGSVRICKTGKVTRKKDGKVIYKCKIGKLLNQKYVDKVMEVLK